MELFEFGDLGFFDLGDVEFEKGRAVHLVPLFQVGIEAVVQAVGEQAEFGFGGMEIAEQLGIVRVEFFEVVLAFDEDGGLAFFHDGIVDLLPFLDADIGDEFRVDLERVKYVVAQYLDKWHDERVLGGFLGFELRQQFFYACG